MSNIPKARGLVEPRRRSGTWQSAFRLAFAGAALTLFGASCDRQPRAPEVELLDCYEKGVVAKCGSLGVPEDRRSAPTSEQQGDKLWLSYLILPAHSARRESPVFFLAGGPGQSAISLTGQLAPLFEELRRERDVVLLDQRGTGKSGGLNCDAGSPRSSHLIRLAEASDYCRAQLSIDPALYSTDAAADDLEDLRVALGYDTIHLVGASYGTRLALRYAERHPGRARSLVLDGVVPPEMRLFLDALPDAQRALDLVFERCAKTPACDSAYPKLKTRFYRLLAELDRIARLPMRDPGSPAPFRPPSVDEYLLLSTIRLLLYSPEGTALIPHLITEAIEGSSEGLTAAMSTFTRGTAETLSTGLTLSVICAEDIPRFTEAELDQAAQQSFISKEDSFQIRHLCEKWIPGAAPGARPGWQYVEPNDAGAPDAPDASAAPPSPSSVKLSIPDPKQPRLDVPALLLSGALDPVTPPRWGELALTRLPRGRHLVVPDAAHGTLHTGCVARLMTEFIRRGEAASIDASCLEGREPPPLFISKLGPGP